MLALSKNSWVAKKVLFIELGPEGSPYLFAHILASPQRPTCQTPGAPLTPPLKRKVAPEIRHPSSWMLRQAAPEIPHSSRTPSASHSTPPPPKRQTVPGIPHPSSRTLGSPPPSPFSKCFFQRSAFDSISAGLKQSSHLLAKTRFFPCFIPLWLFFQLIWNLVFPFRKCVFL